MYARYFRTMINSLFTSHYLHCLNGTMDKCPDYQGVLISEVS